MPRAVNAAALASTLLAACATTTPNADWSMVEGCWIDASDAQPPASMVWRTDPDHPGVLMGTWSVASSSEDPDVVTFALGPDGDHRRLCERAPGAAETCVRAVLSGQHVADGDAIFAVTADTLAFGYSDRPAPFYIGRRGGCA